MDEPDPTIVRTRHSQPLGRPGGESSFETTAADFRAEFGEEIESVLAIESWQRHRDLQKEYERIEREVHEGIGRENELHRRVRAEVLPKIARPHDKFPTGVFSARLDAVAQIHRGLLFTGGVEACDGTIQVHDTLPLTVYHVGVSLVSYRGNEGIWQQQLFRRDLSRNGGDPVANALDELERRNKRAAMNHGNANDPLGELARNAVMAYAERAILLERSTATWRIGHGSPVNYELLTGGGIVELMAAGINAVRGLVEKHRKFIYVASEPRERFLLTIGQALPPMHYALVSTLAERIEGWVKQRRFTTEGRRELLWDDKPLRADEWIPRFLRDVASQVVVGVYRASAAAPAQLFYCHCEHAHYAAHIVLADSMLQEQRGFPLLIDLADHVCNVVFGGGLQKLTEAAYASAGAPWRFETERTTRMG